MMKSRSKLNISSNFSYSKNKKLENGYRIDFKINKVEELAQANTTDARIKYCLMTLNNNCYDFHFYNKYEEEINGLLRIGKGTFEELFNFYYSWNSQTVKNFNQKVEILDRYNRIFVIFFDKRINRSYLVELKEYPTKKINLNHANKIMYFIFSWYLIPIRVFFYCWVFKILLMLLGGFSIIIMGAIGFVELIHFLKNLP